LKWNEQAIPQLEAEIKKGTTEYSITLRAAALKVVLDILREDVYGHRGTSRQDAPASDED